SDDGSCQRGVVFVRCVSEDYLSGGVTAEGGLMSQVEGYRKASFVFLLCLVVTCWTPSKQATTDDFLDTGLGVGPSLTQVTICVRYRLLHVGSVSGPILSYFADGHDNEIQLCTCVMFLTSDDFTPG
ncbi:hypothetical protein Hamer_G027299, partial [Homarus americanus]